MDRMYQDKKKKLIELKEKIMTMPEGMDKNELIYGYYGLFLYLSKINIIKEHEDDFFLIDDKYLEKYDDMIHEKSVKSRLEIINNAPFIISSFKELINVYKDYDFSSFDDDYLYDLDPLKMYSYLFEFFNELGVKELYDKLAIKGNISLCSNLNGLAASVNTIKIGDPCIVIDSTERCFNFYFDLAHEMGHCFQFYLQRKKTHCESLYIFTEMTSTLFERLFCEFLKTKNIDSKILSTVELQNHLYNLSNIGVGKILCELLLKDEIIDINQDTLKFKAIYTPKQIVDMVEKDCGYVLIDEDDLYFSSMFYSIGDVMTNYFIGKMKKDFKNTWKEYKEFIQTDDLYPLKESLDKYFDIDLMKKNIKTFMKSYPKR